MTLKVEQLSFERNFQTLLQNIHFELRAGESLQVCGANGSGKSTLLRIIAGLIEIEAGKILWHGESITEQRDSYETHFNYIGHLNGVRLQLTVEENLAYFAAINRVGGKVLDTALSRSTTKGEEIDRSHLSMSLQFDTALSRSTTKSEGIDRSHFQLYMGLPRQKQAVNLSAGQKRRLALSRLILNPTPLWILDEPTTALDQEGQSLFFDLLKEHLAQGGMAILTSHHELPLNLVSQKISLGEQYV